MLAIMLAKFAGARNGGASKGTSDHLLEGATLGIGGDGGDGAARGEAGPEDADVRAADGDAEAGVLLDPRAGAGALAEQALVLGAVPVGEELRAAGAVDRGGIRFRRRG